MTCNEIWIIAETRNGDLSRVTAQTLGKSRSVGEEQGHETIAVLMGGEQHLANELALLADRVLWLDDPACAPYEATRYVDVLAKLIEVRGIPAAILTGAGSAGLEFMPRLAARVRAAYLSSCVDLWWSGDHVVARRPIHGGKVYEEVAFVSRPAVATVRPGVFSAAAKSPTPGTIEKMSLTLSDPSGPRVVEQVKTVSGGKDILEASCVVSGGRGMGSAENFKLIEDLAGALDGATGASRAIVDSGWRPHDEQVGKSGKTISPELYIACGISGAIHHTLGMNTAKFVVAINTDPDALIFQSADIGIVGDAVQVVPAITAALKAE